MGCARFRRWAAGSSAAIVLARSGRRVLLIDRNMDEGFKAGESLPPAAKPILRRLGVFERFCAGGHLPSYGNASVWGSPELRAVDFIRDPNGHGWHLDRVRFDQMLREAAAEAGAHLRVVEADTRWEATAEGWRSGLGSVQWILDCTGRKSQFCRGLGVLRQIFDSLLSHVAVFRAGVDDPDSLTVIEAAPDGWWYTAVVPGNRRVVAYQTAAIRACEPGMASRGLWAMAKSTQ